MLPTPKATPGDIPSTSGPLSTIYNAKKNFKWVVQLPPCWMEKPIPWFELIETQFYCNSVHTDDDKLAQLVCALPQSLALKFMYEINYGVKGVKYDILKLAIAKRSSFIINNWAKWLPDIHDITNSQELIVNMDQHINRMHQKLTLVQRKVFGRPWTTSLSRPEPRNRTANLSRRIRLWDIKKNMYDIFKGPSSYIYFFYCEQSLKKDVFESELGIIKEKIDRIQKQLIDIQQKLTNMYRGNRKKYRIYRSKSLMRLSSRLKICCRNRRQKIAKPNPTVKKPQFDEVLLQFVQMKKRWADLNRNILKTIQTRKYMRSPSLTRYGPCYFHRRFGARTRN